MIRSAWTSFKAIGLSRNKFAVEFEHDLLDQLALIRLLARLARAGCPRSSRSCRSIATPRFQLPRHGEDQDEVIEKRQAAQLNPSRLAMAHAHGALAHRSSTRTRRSTRSPRRRRHAGRRPRA